MEEHALLRLSRTPQSRHWFLPQANIGITAILAIRINNLAGILRIVLPIAKPPLELLRLCYIFDFFIDIHADISYNDIRVLDIFEDGGQLEPEIFYKV